MANLTPSQQPDGGTTDSQPRQTNAYSGRPAGGMDPTLEPGNYSDSLFGVRLPQGTGAPGSQGAVYGGGNDDPTNEPGQLNEGISGLGPADTASTGAPGSQGASNGGPGPDAVSYTKPGSYLSGTYQQGTTNESISGPGDWTQAIDGSYAGGGPQLPGIKGNEPTSTGAGMGRVMRGGRAVGWPVQDLSSLAAGSLAPTSQAGGNMTSSNAQAMTAPGSEPVDPLPDRDHQGNPSLDVSAKRPVGTAQDRRPTGYTPSPAAWKTVN